MGSRAISLSPDGQNVYVASSQQRRDRDLRAQRAHRHAAPAERHRRLHRGRRRERLRQGGRARRPELRRPQPRRPQPLRDLAGKQLRHRLPPQPLDRRAQPAAARRRLRFRLPVPGCATGRALVGPDVLVVSPDGSNVYVGSFFGNAVAVFARSASTGALTQPEGTAGCIAAARRAAAPPARPEPPEGMAVSADGASVYVASALSSASSPSPATRRPAPSPRRPTAAVASSRPAHRLHDRGAAGRGERGDGQPR